MPSQRVVPPHPTDAQSRHNDLYYEKPVVDDLADQVNVTLNPDGTPKTGEIGEAYIPSAPEFAAVQGAVGRVDPVTPLVEGGAIIGVGDGTARAMTRQEVSEPWAWSDFRGAPDGPITTLDSGQSWHLMYSSDDKRMRVVDGAITTVTASGGTAGYAEVELPESVSRIGATVRFSPYLNNGGVAAIVVWATERASSGVIPDSPLHFLLTPVNMSIEVWDSGVGSTTLATKTFTTPLAADSATEHTIDIYIADDRVTAYLSNGDVVTAQDEKIRSHAGQWACWETYAGDVEEDTIASFVEVWADCMRWGQRSLYSSRYDAAVIADLVANKYSQSGLPAIKNYNPNPAVDITLSSTRLRLDTASNELRQTVTFPSSGRVLVTMSAFVDATAGTVYFCAGYDSAFSSQAFNQLVFEGTGKQQVTITRPVVGTPGVSAFFYFGAFVTDGAAVIRQGSTLGHTTATSWQPAKA